MAADLTDAIETRARANSGLRALLGTGTNMRFYRVQTAPKAPKPCVAWWVVSEPRTYAGGGYAGLSRARVMFASYATDHAGAVLLDRAVRDAFNAFTGASVVCSGGTVVILSMEPQSPAEAFDGDGATPTYSRIRDVLFWWRDNA